MCVRSLIGCVVPELTVRVARACDPHGTTAMAIRDHHNGLWSDEDFKEWYPRDGRPGLSPAQLETVSVLQFLLELSDRQAAESVRSRIDFTYALGRELEDPGFHHSMLTNFRERLTEEDRADRLLGLALENIRAVGLVRGRGRQRTDSTHVLAAVRRRHLVLARCGPLGDGRGGGAGPGRQRLRRGVRVRGGIVPRVPLPRGPLPGCPRGGDVGERAREGSRAGDGPGAEVARPDAPGGRGVVRAGREHTGGSATGRRRAECGESYVFAKEQEFLAVSRDGRTLLRTVDKNTVGILHLDRALWKKELCDTAWASVSAVRVKFLILVV